MFIYIYIYEHFLIFILRISEGGSKICQASFSMMDACKINSQVVKKAENISMALMDLSFTPDALPLAADLSEDVNF